MKNIITDFIADVLNFIEILIVVLSPIIIIKLIVWIILL